MLAHRSVRPPREQECPCRGGSSRRRWPYSRSIRLASGVAAASPYPPANSAGARRGEVRATPADFRQLRRGCSLGRSRRAGPASPRRAGRGRRLSARPPRFSSGSPASPDRRRVCGPRRSSPPGRREAGARRTPSACSDARSTHCASSMMQTVGRSAPASPSSVSTARPTRRRSGAAPSRRPSATRSAFFCGSGNRSMSTENRAAQLLHAGVGELHLRFRTADRMVRRSAAFGERHSAAARSCRCRPRHG